MKKKVMTFNELIEFGKQHGISAEHMRSRIQQNAIEISMEILPQMLEIKKCDELGIDRSVMIANYIEVWAREAEERWLNSKEALNGEYNDFIINFSKKKLDEFKEEFSDVPAEKSKKTYRMKALFYTSLEVVVEAANKDEAKSRGMEICGSINEASFYELGKNAVLEGVEDITEVSDVKE